MVNSQGAIAYKFPCLPLGVYCALFRLAAHHLAHVSGGCTVDPTPQGCDSSLRIPLCSNAAFLETNLARFSLVNRNHEYAESQVRAATADAKPAAEIKRTCCCSGRSGCPGLRGITVVAIDKIRGDWAQCESAVPKGTRRPLKKGETPAPSPKVETKTQRKRTILWNLVQYSYCNTAGTVRLGFRLLNLSFPAERITSLVHRSFVSRTKRLRGP
jgi:hypothetical protein